MDDTDDDMPPEVDFSHGAPSPYADMMRCRSHGDAGGCGDAVTGFMARHGVTDEDLDRMAKPYEDGTFEPEPDGEVLRGSHVDAVAGSRAPSGNEISDES